MVIDGAVQGVQYIWYTKLTTEDCVFILVDGKKHAQQDQLNQNDVDSLSFIAIQSLLRF